MIIHGSNAVIYIPKLGMTGKPENFMQFSTFQYSSLKLNYVCFYIFPELEFSNTYVRKMIYLKSNLYKLLS